MCTKSLITVRWVPRIIFAVSRTALRGTGEGVVVEFDATPEAVHDTLTALHERGAQIRAEGRGYVISGDDGLTTLVRDTLADTGAGVRSSCANSATRNSCSIQRNSSSWASLAPFSACRAR